MLVNNWSDPMLTILCLSCSYLNTPFIMPNFCSNYPVLWIFSTTLDNDIDLEHCAGQAVFFKFQNMKTFLLMVEVSFC